MTEEAGFLELGDGGRLSWRASGNGPAALLIHGGSIDSRMWDAQVAALEADYRAITYDIRGIGASDRPTAPYRMSDDALAVLDHLGVGAAAVFGFSIGSQIALDLVTRVPERVPALVVSGVMPWNPDAGEPVAGAYRDLKQRLRPRDRAQERGDLAAAVAADLDVWAGAHHGEAREALTALCMQVPYFHEYKALHGEWYGLIPPVADADLAVLACPALVILGEHDVPVAHLAAERVVGVLGRARLEVVPGTDHFVNLGDPKRVDELLLEFLDARRVRGEW